MELVSQFIYQYFYLNRPENENIYFDADYLLVICLHAFCKNDLPVTEPMLPDEIEAETASIDLQYKSVHI